MKTYKLCWSSSWEELGVASLVLGLTEGLRFLEVPGNDVELDYYHLGREEDLAHL